MPISARKLPRQGKHVPPAPCFGRLRWLKSWLCLVACGWPAPCALAGGGPENVFVVVNATSWASLTVANHFIALRRIPPVNVLCLNWDGGFESIEIEAFRQRILLPALSAIDKRGLAAHIDYIVYSSDFPYMIAVTDNFGDKRPPPQLSPAASINGVTFLWQFALAKSPAILSLDNNQYMRAGPQRQVSEPTLAFSSQQGFGPSGLPGDPKGVRYMLSLVLAETSGRGTSVREAVNYLSRSAAADGTMPAGTVYFAKTDDIRSRVRQTGFSTAIAELKELGVAGQIEMAAAPKRRKDVQGAMLGAANYDWAATGSTILPGAICENFTSFGGILREEYGQTSLAEPLRHGAAGASGTVDEPFAIPMKFPSPQMHVHYARGCTLAEAFYQSIQGPYQLLIVGDPLCRPWAHIPQVQVTAPAADETISGTIAIEAAIANPGGAAVERVQLFVDGRLAGQQIPGKPLKLDTTGLADGWHELRVVAIEGGPIASGGRALVPVQVDNHGRQLACTAAARVPYAKMLPVKFEAVGDAVASYVVLQNNRQVAKSDGADGAAQIDTRLLGTGPVTLQAVALDTGGKPLIFARPLAIDVTSPIPRAPVTSPGPLVRGLKLTLASGTAAPIHETREPPNWLAAAGVKPAEPYVLEGYFDVDREDMYQFQLWHYGSLRAAVDGQAVYEEEKGTFTPQFVPVALMPGTHRLELSGVAGGEAKLRANFGGSGTHSLSDAAFKHAQ